MHFILFLSLKEEARIQSRITLFFIKNHAASHFCIMEHTNENLTSTPEFYFALFFKIQSKVNSYRILTQRLGAQGNFL